METDGKSGIRKDFIQDVWLFESDEEPDISKAFTLEEITQTTWKDMNETRKMYRSDETTDNIDYIFDVIDNPVKDYGRIIGATVKGTIDRPIGSHHPRHHEMIYSINYGYVDGTIAGDGAEQDVFVFGTEEPIDHFEGKVIAVYHRFNDVEDKWIVSVDGKDHSDDEILARIAFQEQYFYGVLCRK